VKCKRCGAALDLTQNACAACGAELELGRLTGILGVVCRACDAYNEPGAKTCVGCGKPIGASAEVTPPAAALALAPPTEPAEPLAIEPPAAAATGPVIRSFGKPGAATRFVPAIRPASAEAPALTPIPLVAHCPRCDEEAGPGQFCARCGQPLGARGTQIFTRPAIRTFPATTPLTPGRARLVLERGAGVEGSSFRLGADAVQAGRRGSGVAFPDDPCLAPLQATFFYRSGALHVRDEGAPGGVLLKLRGGSVPLRPGDLFAVGDRLLRFAGPLASAPPPSPDGTRRLGAPRPTAPAVVLEECLEGGAAGHVFVRGGPSITIGRAGCAVNLGEDPDLSQAHAEVAIALDGSAKLRDLGSSSGTFVGIPSRAERELRDGDCVRLGREILRVAV
jgi:hypothetical protein